MLRNPIGGWLKAAALAAACAMVGWAGSDGPDAHYTGVPVPGGFAEPTCVTCHQGTSLNGGGGKVTITSSEVTKYTPGQKQTLTIVVTDTAAKSWGFQMTARLASDLSQPAGTFIKGSNQWIQCAANDLSDLGTTTCSADRPLQFIEHSRALASNTISVDWTPPPTAVGDIVFYVSAVAANANGNEFGDHVYNTSVTLQASANAAKPVIATGGVISASSFGGAKTIAPGTWVEIYGTNLAASTGEWAASDFKGTTAPIKLANTSVTIAGKDAFVRYLSPGQVNVQAPDGIGTGPVPVVVTTIGGASDPVTVTATDRAPGMLALNSYLAAFQGAAIVGSPGYTAVKPGDIVTFYGIGFGAVTPAVAAGQINGAANSLANPLSITIGGATATPTYQGLGPGLVGLYQFNVTVPAVPDGDQPVAVSVGGQSTNQTLKLTVKN